MTDQTLVAQRVPIGSLKPYKGNARIGDVQVIRQSLRINGQYRPIVVRTKTKEILAGNHTWKAAVEEGWTEIWVTFIDCDAQKAKRINLVDNRSAELGGYDEAALTAQLGSLPSLEGTGWTTDDLQKKLLDLAPTPNGDSPEEPVPDDEYHSQLGVMVMCTDQEMQEEVYKDLKKMLPKFEGAELKVVAI